jgi:hypothetical protein
MYVLIVSPLFQYVATCAIPHALWLADKHALHKVPLHHQAWSHSVEHAASTTRVCALCSLPLSLALGHARCDPSLVCNWSLTLGHGRCALSTCIVFSLIWVHRLCSLSHVVGQTGGGVGRSNRRRHVFPKQIKHEERGAQQHPGRRRSMYRHPDTNIALKLMAGSHCIHSIHPFGTPSSSPQVYNKKRNS